MHAYTCTYVCKIRCSIHYHEERELHIWYISPFFSHSFPGPCFNANSKRHRSRLPQGSAQVLQAWPRSVLFTSFFNCKWFSAQIFTGVFSHSWRYFSVIAQRLIVGPNQTIYHVLIMRPEALFAQILLFRTWPAPSLTRLYMTCAHMR